MSLHALHRTPSSGEWVAALFLAYVGLQRFAVPGTPVALVLPVTVIWLLAALRCGVVTLERTRWILGLASLAATACAAVLASVLGRMPIASLGSWTLLMATWAPMVFVLTRADRHEYLVLLRRVATIGVGLAALAVGVTASQAVGIGYVDLLAEVVPSGWLFDTFNTNAEVAYGSGLIKGNAWIGLEPSFVSLELGVALLAALLARRPWWVPTVIAAGMACTLSGSGLVLVAVGLVVIASSRLRPIALRLLLPGAAVGAVLALLPAGAIFLARTSEFTTPGSSGSIRAVEPYGYLLPAWTAHLDGLLLGLGPGSSQSLVNAPGIPGLIVPVPAKVFVDYGLLAGLLLAFFMVSCHLRAPSRSIALALFLAYWSIQPAATLMLLVGQIAIFAAWWSPAADVLEDRKPAEIPRGRPRRGSVELPTWRVPALAAGPTATPSTATTLTAAVAVAPATGERALVVSAGSGGRHAR